MSDEDYTTKPLVFSDTTWDWANYPNEPYDPTSLTEVYTFPHWSEGRGSKVQFLPGGENLGSSDDIMNTDGREFKDVTFDKTLEVVPGLHRAMAYTIEIIKARPKKILLPIIKRINPMTFEVEEVPEVSEPQECLPSSVLNKKRTIDDNVETAVQHNNNLPTASHGKLLRGAD